LPNQAAADDIRCLGFELGPLLGSGAMSAVYAIKRLVPVEPEEGLAIKLLHPMHLENVELVLRFFNEQRAAQRVHHPAVIRVLDAGLIRGRPYLLMERCADTLLQRALTISHPERITVTAQVASGALALHQAGIVHREAYEKTMTCFRVSAKDAHRRRTSHGYSEAEDGPHSQPQLI